MNKTILALRGALLAATALLIAPPAQATPRPATGGNWLYLTVTKGDARSRDVRGTLLMCDPPQGHARAAQACAQLKAVHGDIRRIPHERTYCTMLYAPVTVSARGEWSRHQVAYSHTFPNMCELSARTGAVFALSERLPGRRRAPEAGAGTPRARGRS